MLYFTCFTCTHNALHENLIEFHGRNESVDGPWTVLLRQTRPKVSNMVQVKNSWVDSFPCVFKMSKMAGFLPFKKGIDEATGYQIAQPLCSFSTMGILALSKTFLISFLAFGIYLSTSQADISLMELLEIIMVDINEPGFDTITFLATFFSVQLLNAGIEYGIYCLRKTLPELRHILECSPLEA